MITPTRFGLKYSPVPTLALEYEEDLKSIEDASGMRSLYVYRDGESATTHILKKVHVVELPQLTRQSEPSKIVQQLQQDSRRFLGPGVVKQEQLMRLLQQLMEHLNATGDADDRVGVDHTSSENRSGDEERSDSEARGGDAFKSQPMITRGQFNIHDTNEDEEDAAISEAGSGDKHDELEGRDTKTKEESDHQLAADNGHEPGNPDEVKQTDQDTVQRKEDEKKHALKEASEASEEEEDVESEELEYFSEDGSDEDSF